MECGLFHCKAIQLVKDYTAEHAWLQVRYYLSSNPDDMQSFQGLIDHLSLTFQSFETVSSLYGDIYERSQKLKNRGSTG